MIARLSGRLLEKLEDRVIVDVGGVGYEVFAPGSTLTRLPAAGAAVVLHTVTHVREDALQLYGFVTPDEKHLFESVTAVGGVGPKLGLAILSGLNPAAFRRAILERNLTALTGISGIGRKTAERLVVELRDRLGGEAGDADLGADGGGESSTLQDAVAALVTLGYPRLQAVKAVRDSTAEVKPGAAVDVLVRRALGRLAARPPGHGGPSTGR